MQTPEIPQDADETSDGSSGTSTTTAEKKILQRLLFDESEFLSRLEETIDRALKFFKIEPKTGRIVLTDDAKDRRVPDQIRILLAGRYFAYRIGIIPTPQMNYREIAVELNRPDGSVSPELTNLVRDGDLARGDDGLVSMPFHRIDGILRGLEQSVPATSEGEMKSSAPRKVPSRRSMRSKSDPVMQGILEKPADLSAYAWIRNLKTAREKGLAALLVAKDVYGVEDLTCPQMTTLLTQKFPVKVRREAINMGMMGVRGSDVDAVQRGNEIAYRLLPYGREYITQLATKPTEESTTTENADKE